MKKYLLGIFAIVMAVSFSAFKTVVKTNKKSVTTTAYFWYSVNPSTGKITSTAINGTSYTKEQALGQESPFQAITECEDDPAQPLCLVGSLLSSLEPGDNIPVHDEDNSILMRDENQ